MTRTQLDKVDTPGGTGATRWRNQRGAIIIHVAIALLGLLAFSAFSIDHGVMMVSRGEAQNAADAGAWAAGLYLAWDDSTDQAGAQAIGVSAAQQNSIWGATPDITTTDVTFPTCPPGAPGPVDTCVRVDVYRNQRAGGNPLPVFFSSLIGVADQGVRATATAQVLYGSSANCMLPFAIPDRWLELRLDEGTDPPGGVPDATDNPLNFPFDESEGMTNVPDGYWDPEGDFYDAYETQGQQAGDPLTGVVDLYAPGPPLMGGTGFDAFRDYGIQVMLKASNGSQIAPSDYYPVVLPDGCGTGASCYRQRIVDCSDAEIPEDFVFTVETGNMVGPTAQGIADLIALDPGASWDPTISNADGTLGGITGGCLGAGTCTSSPRWRAVPVFDIENYMSGHRTGRGDVLATGFVGMFVDAIVAGDVRGYLTTIDFAPNAGNLTTNTSSFLRTVILVR